MKALPFLAALLASGSLLMAQSAGSAGTVTGTVVDPSGLVVAGAKVQIRNSITGYTQSSASDTKGTFRLLHLPPNP